MVGVFPVDTILKRKPQGLGYIRVRVEEANPFYPVGTVLSGHEFHYSSLVGLDCTGNSYVFKVLRGWGIDGSRDGICTRNVLGTYMHLHALGEPLWAQGILNTALEFKTAGDWRSRDTFPKQVEKER
jgi:cobyrinic acid a,c-diamide synthase